MSVPSLSRSLSDRDNPTLKTLAAVTTAVGLQLTVVERPATKRPSKTSVPASD